MTVDFSPIVVVKPSPLIREVEQLNRMCYPDGKSCGAEARTNLHQATWIPRDDQVRPWLCCREAPDFAVEHRTSHTRLQDGVDPCAAAASVRPGQEVKPQ